MKRLMMIVGIALGVMQADGAPVAGEPPLTLHVIIQSHLDPVWLWDRGAGTDAAIATARTCCDVLDAFPEIHVTRGESWIYETVEQCDPATFARMRRLVAEGRLHVVGGTYVQPDCNGPSAESFRRQYAVGGKYFREQLGVSRVKTGYNPDSFGHCGYLPKFLREAGCENYMFMRPVESEKHLPAVFRWRAPSGEEVLAGRIPGGWYATVPKAECVKSQIEESVRQADRRYGHAVVFIGVGDHGGGPARREIQWILDHRNDFPGVKLVFSHPDAFFDAVRASGVEPPLVVGELQHHAVGCYSALSRIKREVRQTEDALERNGGLLAPDRFEAAWKKVLFADFHDIYGGACVESAYADIYDGLAAVRAEIRDAELLRTRRLNCQLPPDPCQRLVFDNPGDTDYSGLYEFEPWINGAEAYYLWNEASNATVRIRDEAGARVVVQRVPYRDKSERTQPRYAAKLDVPAGGRRILRLDYAGAAPERADPPSGPVPDFRFEVIEDATDTWSHGVSGYPEATRVMTAEDAERIVTEGPLLRETRRRYTDAGGEVWVRTRHERGLGGTHLKLRVTWSGPRQILKLAVKPPFKASRRVDGVPGGELERALDGEEYPIRDFCRVEGDGKSFACVSTAVTAADVRPDGTIRLTLLRTPYYCHHDPAAITDPSMPVTDLGVHDLDVTFLFDPSADDIRREVCRQTDPLVFSETTYGVSQTFSSCLLRASATASERLATPRLLKMTESCFLIQISDWLNCLAMSAFE